MEVILRISIQTVIPAVDKEEYEKKRGELLQKLRDMELRPLIDNEYEIK